MICATAFLNLKTEAGDELTVSLSLSETPNYDQKQRLESDGLDETQTD